MAGERYVWRIVLRNFINSLRPRQITGNDMGTDYIGNKYYEIPADPQGGKRKPSRWYDPPKGQDFQDPVPAEWESWLRFRRIDPPSEAEIEQNLAIMKMKKENAAQIESRRLAEGGSLASTPERGQQSFPSYSEYQYRDEPKKNK